MRTTKLFATFAAASILTAAAEPLRLQPTSKWVVDMGENSCRLIRIFGEGRDETKLVLESIGPGDLTMLVIGKPLYTPKFEPSVHSRLLPDSRPTTGRAAVGAAGRDPAAFWAAPEYSDSGTQVELDSATAIQIDMEGGQPIVLDTGPLSSPLGTFDQCAQTLLLDFGLDPEVQKKIAKPASAPGLFDRIGTVITASTSSAERRLSEASIRLLVDADGKISKCVSTSRFAAADFTASVCNQILRNAKGKPAELADGTKVPSYIVGHITFTAD